MNIRLPRVTVGELIDTLSQLDRDIYVNFSELDFVQLSEPSCGYINVVFLQRIKRDPDGYCEIKYN